MVAREQLSDNAGADPRSIHAGDPLTPLRNPTSREPGVIFLSKREGCWMFPASAGLALLALAMNCGQSTVSSCSRGGGFV